MGERWTWAASLRSSIATALAGPDWCDRLEQAGPDAVTGKVLCVCAAAAVGRAALAAYHDRPKQAAEALELLWRWIDDPTGERFDRICGIIFPEGDPPAQDPHGVVWWALRTATSSVGNYEAGWALASTCGAAETAGFSPEQLRGLAEQELASRCVG